MIPRSFFNYRLSALISIFLLNSIVNAQTQGEHLGSYGGYLNASINFHTANFQTLPGVPSCCPRFENGTGLGIDAGIYYGWPSDSRLSLELRIGYNTLDGTLQKNEFTTVTVDDQDAQGIFQHSVRSSIGMVALSPLATYALFDNFQLLGGITAGYVLSASYDEKEEIVEPQNSGTFKGGSRIRNQFSGVIPEVSTIYIGLTAGGQYRLPLNASRTLHLCPEVRLSYGISPIAPGLHWQVHSIKAGFAVQYDRYREIPTPVIDTPIPPPPPPILVEVKPKLPILTAHLATVMLDTDGIEKPIDELIIEDYIRTQYRPLLNYVFFEQGSATLSSRYHTLHPEETGSFSINKLNTYETLPLYYEILNVIGKRMKNFPTANLTLTGCNDDQGIEKNNRQLSKARAESLYAYFKDVWDIPPSRMRIEFRNLPQQPSSVSDSDGAQENRRVEITSNIWQVMEPIFTTDTAHIPKPAVVRFIPQGTVESGVRRWQVSSFEPRKKLKDFSGKDSLPSRLDWELEKERETTLAKLDTVSASLTITDNRRETVESLPITLPVRHYTLADKHREGSIDTIISRYSLILFDFDRSELSDANRRIADFVKERISEKAKVNIFGYTDRIGTDEYNRQLSEQRAISTQHYIGLGRAEVKGLGRRFLLYDNSLPEGRFYSRTVTVIVSTPMKR